jgi:IS5 family transposase
MKMPLFTRLQTKYESMIWAKNPELGLLDTLLEAHPELLDYIKDDIMRGQKSSNFGRGDKYFGLRFTRNLRDLITGIWSGRR